MLNSVLGLAKQSAKEVTKNELYKLVLTGGETVRLLKTRIVSSKHRHMTVVCNKKSLLGYDDRQYILNDKITTLTVGRNVHAQYYRIQIGVRVMRKKLLYTLPSH